MIAVIDYGIGNLHSVQKALERVGADVCVTHDVETIRAADKIVLPGVGAMQPAMEKLSRLNLIPVLDQAVQDQRPFLGICLGYQLLFEYSDEGGQVKGLGFLQGRVEKFSSQSGLKIPHMGWNRIVIEQEACPIFQDITDGADVYFCHSYFVNPTQQDIRATKTDYGIDFASSVAKDHLFGVQFHPEKSQVVGLKILNNFNNM
ncbi:MAG: imidazole glycerol phosphate synthase subunit HisH [Candidatus Omnitrophica bacterium]|nr:imidazole glycerol phosphate synthase subunit HisH [Candidatus Omnitrophota bacterium]